MPEKLCSISPLVLYLVLPNCHSGIVLSFRSFNPWYGYMSRCKQIPENEDCRILDLKSIWTMFFNNLNTCNFYSENENNKISNYLFCIAAGSTID